MKVLIALLLMAITFLSCGTAGTASDIPKPSGVNFKGEKLPNIQMFPGWKTTLQFEKDNDSTLTSEYLKIVDAVSEYLRVNTEHNVYLRCFMHENELEKTNVKRRDFIRKRISEAGISEKRVLANIEKPMIPQDESDIFTEEELIKARRVDMQIMK